MYGFDISFIYVICLQPKREREKLRKPNKINASTHFSLPLPFFQAYKKHLHSLFSKLLSKMLHFFPIEFAKTLDFTGFPVISHLFTDGLMLKRPFVSYSVKLHYICDLGARFGYERVEASIQTAATKVINIVSFIYCGRLFCLRQIRIHIHLD